MNYTASALSSKTRHLLFHKFSFSACPFRPSHVSFTLNQYTELAKLLRLSSCIPHVTLLQTCPDRSAKKANAIRILKPELYLRTFILIKSYTNFISWKTQIPFPYYNYLSQKLFESNAFWAQFIILYQRRRQGTKLLIQWFQMYQESWLRERKLRNFLSFNIPKNKIPPKNTGFL